VSRDWDKRDWYRCYKKLTRPRSRRLQLLKFGDYVHILNNKLASELEISVLAEDDPFLNDKLASDLDVAVLFEDGNRLSSLVDDREGAVDGLVFKVWN
jgi:hypothetical protein